MASSENLKLSWKEKDREDKSSVLWRKQQQLSEHMLRAAFSGLHRALSRYRNLNRQETVPCAKKFLTMVFNLTNNTFSKIEKKILVLYNRPKPE